MMMVMLLVFGAPRQVVAALTSIQLSPEVRAQDLSVEQFAQCHWALHDLVLAQAGLLTAEQAEALQAQEQLSEADAMSMAEAAESGSANK